MAAGLPVIASDVPACREVVGNAGLLVEPRSPQKLADALDGLSANPEQRARLAKAGEQRARAQFDIATTARAYAEAALGPA